MIAKHKCLRCKNFISGQIRTMQCKCKAFPNGIPEMKLAYISHDPCIDCNNGIGFESTTNPKTIE